MDFHQTDLASRMHNSLIPFIFLIVKQNQDCLCYIHKKAGKKIFDLAELGLIRAQLGVNHWSILSQLHELMQSRSLEAAIETLTGAYFEIYDRDLKTTFEENSSTLSSLFWSSLSVENLKRNFTNATVIETFFMKGRTAGTS